MREVTPFAKQIQAKKMTAVTNQLDVLLAGLLLSNVSLPKISSADKLQAGDLLNCRFAALSDRNG